VNLSSVFRAALRRWYVSIPGLLLSALLAYGAHSYVQPTYTRSASVVLIPAKNTIPKNSNPYLYIGGLSEAADVLVTAASSESVTKPILAGMNGTTLTIARDVSSSGPVLSLTVETPDRSDAGPVLTRGIAAVATTLTKLQVAEHLESNQMITSSTLSLDTTSTPKVKSQLMATVAAGGIGLGLTLLLSNLLDGLLLARRQRHKRDDQEPPATSVARRASHDELALPADSPFDDGFVRFVAIRRS